jgi:hypothetical protein
MPPRRPTTPHAGAAKARAGGSSAARLASGASAGSTTPGRSTTAGGSASGGRAPSRPFPVPVVPPHGGGGSGRPRRPVIRPVTMLSGVLVVLILMIAPYVRPWVSQRSQISEGNQRVRQLQRDVDALADESRRWQDPAYVRAQARERLHFVMPGETGYVVLDDSPATQAKADPRSADAAVPARVADEPWYARVWESVQIAGDPTTEQARSGRPSGPAGASGSAGTSGSAGSIGSR